jgi:hypothetical protein
MELVLALSLALSASPDPGLSRLLACHDQAVGGSALRKLRSVEMTIRVEENGSVLDGTYRATRDGRMRIDVFRAGQRVFSEGLDGQGAWERPGGATEPTPRPGAAEAALRHGVLLPGKLWTLADLPGMGHEVVREGRDADGELVRVKLADGFVTWFVVDAKSCQIVRRRDFRAFHPSLDPKQRWVETRFSQFEKRDGMTWAGESVDLDLATGKTLSRTTLVGVRPDAGEPAPR